MIDIDQLPHWARVTIKTGYFVWVVVVAILALVIVIFDAFGICDVDIDAEVAILIGIAMVAPIIPFVQQMTLPGGGGFKLSPSRQSELAQTLREGTGLGEIAIEEFDLEKMIRGDL